MHGMPQRTGPPQLYYDSAVSPAAVSCVGCQAWSKAQGSGSCPVGVRRFKSCPTHLLPRCRDGHLRLTNVYLCTLERKSCRVRITAFPGFLDPVCTWSL